MAISPDMAHLASMLDDPDNETALNVLARMLALQEDLSEVTSLLQESPDPLVRRRIHTLQNALTMRDRRRSICTLFNQVNERPCNILHELINLHLLWFDKDQSDEVNKEVAEFLKHTEKFPLTSLKEAEFFMREKCFMPEKETTIRPESYCIGTVIFHRQGAASVLLALLWHLLGRERFQMVQVMGNFALMDDRQQVLLGNGNWQLESVSGVQPVIWSEQMILRYIASTLMSCAVNSDSYRYVMSIARALTGDESKHLFDDFPYPFGSFPESCDDEQ